MVGKLFLGLVVEMKFYVYYVYTVQRRTLYAIKAFKGLLLLFYAKITQGGRKLWQKENKPRTYF